MINTHQVIENMCTGLYTIPKDKLSFNELKMKTMKAAHKHNATKNQ